MGGGFSTAKKVSVEPPSQNNVGVTAEDAANKAAAARKRDKKWKKGMNWRSPSGDTTDMPWKVYGGASIAPLLREDDELGGAPVALIDARFLVELARAGGRLIRRQDLPRGAFLDLATLRRMPGIRNGLRVLCVSYPWHTPSHPDPKGTTLQLLAAVLERFVADAAWDPAGTCAVFLDFCSLYQSDAAGRRTASEQILFDRGLKGTPCISELYSHQTTWILKVTTLPRGYPDGFDFSLPGGAKGDPNLASYYDRGWCFCESSMGNLVKSFRFVLDLASFSGKEAKLEGVSEECRAGRPPPVTPARFRALLEDKSFTSKRADIEAVGNLYEGAFEQRMGEAETLKYAKLGWTDEDVKVLCEALGAARSLKALYLNRNRIGSEGVRALAGALRDGKAPSLRKVSFHDLHLQNLDDNPAVSEADKQALRDAREGLLVE